MEIRTNRLVIKPFCDGDTQAALDLLTNDSIKQTYMLPDFEKPEDALPLFRRLTALSLDERRFVRGIYLGTQLVGFLNDVEIKNDIIELGYVMAPDYHGQGFMTEVLRAVIPHLFSLGYAQVIAGAFETNRASIRVMEKAGMKLTGETEELEYREKCHRCLYYSIGKQV